MEKCYRHAPRSKNVRHFETAVNIFVCTISTLHDGSREWRWLPSLRFHVFLILLDLFSSTQWLLSEVTRFINCRRKSILKIKIALKNRKSKHMSANL